MPNVGVGELMLIILVGLLVVGPKRLPELSRSLGKAWRTFQVETKKAQSVLKDAMDEASIPDGPAGIIDVPDGHDAPPRARRVTQAPVKSKHVEDAARVAPVPERALEDT